MEDVLVPWGGRVKLPVFEFRAMFQSLIDDPRLCKELLANQLEQSIKYPSLWQGLLWWDSFHWMVSWYIQALQHSGWHVCSSLRPYFFLDYTHVARNDRQGIECLFFTLSIIPRKFRNRSWSWHPLGIMSKFEANDSKRQNATAFHCVLSVLLWGVLRGTLTWRTHHRCVGTWWPSTNPNIQGTHLFSQWWCWR
jgi:hypothetical protein